MNSQERHIGLMGLGEKSTNFYIAKLNELYNKQHGEDSICPIKILHVDFEKINPYLPYQFDVLIPIVKQHILELNELGVSQIIIPNITLHFTIDRIDLPKEIKDKIVHPIREGVKHILSKNIKEVTLVGTRHTMKSERLFKYFEERNIKVLTPSLQDIGVIDKMRLKVYETGISEELKKEFQAVLSGYKNPLICCTELSLLNTEGEYLDLIHNQIKTGFDLVY